MLISKHPQNKRYTQQIKPITPSEKLNDNPTCNLTIFRMSRAKQTVVKVDIDTESCQKEIISAVAKIKGVQGLAVDERRKTLTVVGNVEPMPIFKALKKIKKNPEIVAVGPAKPSCPYCKYFTCACGGATFYNPPMVPAPALTWQRPTARDPRYMPHHHDPVIIYPNSPTGGSGECSIQ